MDDPSSFFGAAPRSMSRRCFLGGAAAAVTGLVSFRNPAWADEPGAPKPGRAIPPGSNHRYKIGVCDWMILKRQKPGAFQLTSEIGADGVEVDLGSLGDRETFENALADPAVRQRFLDEARRFNLEICSLVSGQPAARPAEGQTDTGQHGLAGHRALA